MAQFNINRASDDTFYRYKMPAIRAKVEGRGNGIKTVIDNCVDVARALQRPAEYVCKHFGFELGAQCQMNAKTERYIVNGSHEAGALQDKLDAFIKSWVLCPSCDNPETSIKIKDGAINTSCKACGYRGELKAIGRMGQYVLKNPPEKFIVGEKAMYEKSGRNASDEKPAAKSSPNRNVEGWGEDDKFALSTDDSARIDRALKDLDSLMGGLTLGVDELVEKMNTEKKYELFVKHCKRIKKEKGDDFAENCAAEIGCLRDTLQLTDGQGVWAYCSAFQKWTDDEKKISDEKFMGYLKKFSSHLKVLCNIDHEDGEKSQKMMLGVFETVVYNNKKKCLPRVAHIIKQLYDDDILEDSLILKWAEKPTKKFVKKSFVEKILADEQMVKLLEWLKEDESSDESSSEEEDSDEESENEENEKQGVSKEAESKEEEVVEKKEEKKEEAVAPVAKQVNLAALDDDDSDDDIDIDDI